MYTHIQIIRPDHSKHNKINKIQWFSKAPAYKAVSAYKAFKQNPQHIFNSFFYIGSKAFSLGSLKSARVKCYCTTLLYLWISNWVINSIIKRLLISKQDRGGQRPQATFSFFTFFTTSLSSSLLPPHHSILLVTPSSSSLLLVSPSSSSLFPPRPSFLRVLPSSSSLLLLRPSFFLVLLSSWSSTAWII